MHNAYQVVLQQPWMLKFMHRDPTMQNAHKKIDEIKKLGQ
jgi:hypothetical protein